MTDAASDAYREQDERESAERRERVLKPVVQISAKIEEINQQIKTHKSEISKLLVEQNKLYEELNRYIR
jgi:hypothetical protein